MSGGGEAGDEAAAQQLHGHQHCVSAHAQPQSGQQVSAEEEEANEEAILEKMLEE
jgi:hypothetical protein